MKTSIYSSALTAEDCYGLASIRRPRIKSPLVCVRLLPDNARRCRFVCDSANFGAAWHRTLSDGTATYEQTRSKYDGGHVLKRQIRSVIVLLVCCKPQRPDYAQGASWWLCRCWSQRLRA